MKPNPKNILVFLAVIALISLTCGCAQVKQTNSRASKANGTAFSFQNGRALHFNSTVANLLPDNLMGMHKFVTLKGKPALEFIKRSHRGPIKYVKDIALVHYIGNRSIMLVWITEYPSSKIAKNQTILMVKGMKKFGSVWSYVNETRLGNLSVYYVPVKNQYFFCKGKYVIYLMPVNMSKSRIAEFAERVYEILPK